MSLNKRSVNQDYSDRLGASRDNISNDAYFTSNASSSSTCFIRGANAASDNITLSILPGSFDTEITLFIPSTVESSLDTTAYIDGVVGGGGQGEQTSANLYIGAIQNSGSPLSTNASLYLNGPQDESSSTEIPLYINPAPIRTDSGSLSFIALGADPTSSAPISDNSNATLYIRNRSVDSGSADLHIETDFNFGDNVSLYIKSTAASGVVTLYSSGKTVEDKSMNLFIKPPQSSQTTLFNRGYRE